MGSDKNQSAKGAKVTRAGAATSGSPFGRRAPAGGLAAIEDVPGILAAIDAVARTGRAIMIARTSDGGAWSITILNDGARHKVYGREQDELDTIFSDILDAYGDVAASPST